MVERKDAELAGKMVDVLVVQWVAPSDHRPAVMKVDGMVDLLVVVTVALRADLLVYLSASQWVD